MRDTKKSDMLTMMSTDRGIHISENMPVTTANQRKCNLIDGHALIRKPGKPKTCTTFNKHAEKLIQNLDKLPSGSCVTLT